MKKFLKLLTGRLFTFIALLAIQIAVLIWLILNFMSFSTYYIPAVYTMAFISVFFIVSRDDHPVFKISWILVILVAPVFGVPFYMLFGNKRESRRVAQQMAKYQEHYEKEMRAVLPEPDESVHAALVSSSSNLARQSEYITNLTGSPAWDHTEVDYFALG